MTGLGIATKNDHDVAPRGLVVIPLEPGGTLQAAFFSIGSWLEALVGSFHHAEAEIFPGRNVMAEVRVVPFGLALFLGGRVGADSVARIM
ncbi:MAG TPA: hypothetical protein VFE62_14755 [Gemmataceae bacterium]|nr:hypothetical protein [Gemmataceae bacterium]